MDFSFYNIAFYFFTGFLAMFGILQAKESIANYRMRKKFDEAEKRRNIEQERIIEQVRNANRAKQEASAFKHASDDSLRDNLRNQGKLRD